MDLQLISELLGLNDTPNNANNANTAIESSTAQQQPMDMTVISESVEMEGNTASSQSAPSQPPPPKSITSLQNYLERKKEMAMLCGDNAGDNANNRSSSEDSSSEDSSSEDSSSEDSSDSDDEMSVVDSEGKAPVAADNNDDEECEDEEAGAEKSANAILKTKNEQLDLPPVRPPPILQLPAQMRMIEVGKVSGIVGDIVLVQSNELHGDNLALDSESILIFEDRQVLGEVFETFGQVDRPIYSVRFNSASEIDRERTFSGAKVYQSPEYSKVVFVAALRALKGSDASNLYDEEIPMEEQEASDDEQEQELKRSRRNAKCGAKVSSQTSKAKQQQNNSINSSVNIPQQVNMGGFNQQPGSSSNKYPYGWRPTREGQQNTKRFRGQQQQQPKPNPHDFQPIAQHQVQQGQQQGQQYYPQQQVPQFQPQQGQVFYPQPGYYMQPAQNAYYHPNSNMPYYPPQHPQQQQFPQPMMMHPHPMYYPPPQFYPNQMTGSNPATGENPAVGNNPTTGSTSSSSVLDKVQSLMQPPKGKKNEQ